MVGRHSKDRNGWLREVATARDALGIRRAAVQLEEALYGEDDAVKHCTSDKQCNMQHAI